jgi:hypothetical protein
MDDIHDLKMPSILERLLALIDWAERFRSDCCFPFIAVDGIRALICGLASGRGGVEVPSMRIGFSGGCQADSEVTVDVRTGAGIGLALAALLSRREGGEDFEFVDGGATLPVTDSMSDAAAVFGRP